MQSQQKNLKKNRRMINFILGLVLGFIGGVVTKFLLKRPHTPNDLFDEMLADFRPQKKGEFIEVNKVTEYLKDNPGEIALGDIIEDENI